MSANPSRLPLVASWALTLMAVVAAGTIWFKTRNASPPAKDPHGSAEHAHGEEEHPAHGGDTNSIVISEQARKNISLTTGKVVTKDFERTISIPGIIVERRGRSVLNVVAPLTGVVTRILHTEGEAVSPGELLFELRLTHEDLVQSQADLLRLSEELVVLDRDIARIEEASKNGAIAGKVLIERQHEKHKQEAMIHAQKQALILHGLSEEQVEAIVDTHVLLKSLEVRVPETSTEPSATQSTVFQVQEIMVEQGQQATKGDTLAVLTDYAELMVEGDAFEQDSPEITAALQSGEKVSAVMEVKGGQPRTIDDLKLLYQTSRVEPTSRTQHFYAVLPNVLVRDTGASESHRFIDWLYRPGQRLTLRVPVETLPNRFVLPLGALAQDGVESYVFRANGNRFERQPVHVEYRDAAQAVIANDGSIFPGDTLAVSGAPQLLMALKNQSGGGIDPHAGHSH